MATMLSQVSAMVLFSFLLFFSIDIKGLEAFIANSIELRWRGVLSTKIYIWIYLWPILVFNEIWEREVHIDTGHLTWL